jgi:thiol-disulfide isomerase/thioredoxin
MKKYILLYFIFFLSGFYCTAQDSIRINGQLLNNSRYAKVIVKKFNIGSYDIAAFPIKEDGSFTVTAPIYIEPGVYRFLYSQSNNEYVDVILDSKEKQINFTLDLTIPVESRLPIFTQSKENSTWYAYQKERKTKLQKIQALQQLVVQYPEPNDKIVNEVQKAINEETKNYHKQDALFSKLNNNTWAAKMISNTPYYFANPKDDWRLQDFEKKEHYWDKISTTAPELINTPLFTEHILEYLKYYMNPEMKFSEEEMNSGFIKSVDIIMDKFGGNDKTKQFALQYLQLGFKEIGNEKVLQYIDEKYATQEQCTTSDNDLQKRLKGYEALKIGNLAPKIELTANDGSVKTLSDYTQEKVVVVFWAGWCPHCKEEMPKLQEWAKDTKNTLVLAISLDEDYTAFQTAAAQFPNMLHTCDLQKWNGKITSDYYIVATPTLFLLDKERKIVGKYSSVATLIAAQNDK